MAGECQHHARCASKPGPKWKQTTLTSELGLLTLSPPARPPPCRTPAPHVVRRIANVPRFRTTDPSLTTFLRFPAEIRIDIYRLLLKRSGEISYPICSVKQRLVAPECWCAGKKYPWIRHRLFPAILECCRIINREGIIVLYGENRFWLGCGCGWGPVVNSWEFARPNLESITMLSVGYITADSVDCQPSFAEKFRSFPRLKDLKVQIGLSAADWEAFLERESRSLQWIAKITFDITVADLKLFRILKRCCQGLGEESKRLTVKDGCFQEYQPPLERQGALLKGRRVKWEFTDSSSEYELVWNVCVFLE
ncbi:hypothetical protein EDB81DRAFT_801989 [Dactylonectria macrodidyma]|uniref:Uncharacterized protein n=1 Tax=Dactylonectria macrodidyma TaxID=307937 RepID=A0A9P9EBQ2_9HYPO|nr:hypothetical protein EDB81DRAFT_801989 [Dactylonectria macrodidyma]